MLVGSDVRFRLSLAGAPLVLMLGIVIVHSWAGENEKALSLFLTTNKSIYSKGEPVKLTLRVTNITGHPVTLSFVSSKQYDFVIKQGDDILWRWSDDKVFAMVLISLILGPNESKQFKVVWDQIDRAGKGVDPGHYEALGFLEIKGSPPSNSVSFEIR